MHIAILMRKATISEANNRYFSRYRNILNKNSHFSLSFVQHSMTQNICMAFIAVQCKVDRPNKFEWVTMYVYDI